MIAQQIKRLSVNAWIMTSIISFLTFTMVLAAAGDLDTTFSGDGLVVSYVVPSNPGRDDVLSSIAIQANRKILAAGYSRVPSTNNSDFALTRYNPNGSLDSTFSGDGRLITDFGAYEAASDIVVQANGKIVVVGVKCNVNGGQDRVAARGDIRIGEGGGGDCDVALARYNAGGTLDTTFSGDGKQTTDYGGDDNGSLGGLAIQSDGKIVVAGYMWNGANYDFAIYRYKTNGSLDTSFSGDGVAVGNFGLGRNDFATDLVIQNDAKIVVAGYTGDASFNNNNFAIARLNANGTADFTFSGDGRQTTSFGGNDFAFALALQSNGKIVVVGNKATPTREYFAIVRYTANGNPDTTFNGTGKKVFSIVPGIDSWAEDVIVQSNGKIVVVGTTGNSTDYPYEDFALVRLNPSGAFDTNFSGNGKVTVGFQCCDEGDNDFGSALAEQPFDGKYVLGGYIHNFGELSEFALARVLP